jgi:hypothetical protein
MEKYVTFLPDEEKEKTTIGFFDNQSGEPIFEKLKF